MMKKISLKSIEIKNFKGISHFTTEFSNRVEIYGRNGLGKTSILDAFLWCMFGKDSSGASSFSVKPLNQDGSIKEHHDVDVLCVIDVDGTVTSLRRKWVEKRSKKDDTYKGNEGVYYINDVPVKEYDYCNEVSKICREDLFKLITSAGAFNRMKDAERRTVLADMSDNFSDKDIAQDFPRVLSALNEGKTIDGYKAEIKAKKSRVSIELEQYPTRLKENADSRPVLPEDIDNYPTIAEKLEKEISGYDKILSASNKDTMKADIEAEIASYNKDLLAVKDSCLREISAKREALNEKKVSMTNATNSIKSRIDSLNSTIQSYSVQLHIHKGYLEQIKDEWSEVNSSEIDSTVDTICPTCGKPFSQQDIDLRKNDIIRAFNEDKLKKLSEINHRGESEVAFIKDIESAIEKCNNEVENLSSQADTISKDIKNTESLLRDIPSIELMLSANVEWNTISAKLENANTRLKCLMVPTDSDAEIIAKKSVAVDQLYVIRKELSKIDEIKRFDERKKELEDKQIMLGQELANLESIESEIMAFSMKKTDMIEKSVSSKFRLVKFKMFEYNISNDGVREVCICTVDGVPYKDLNTAMKYNADIDIINALSNHYDIVAPVFIDRAESINSIEATKGQRIDLYATKEDSVLRVEHIC